MSEGTVRGFSVATRCRTVDEFITKYRDRSDSQSIVVNIVEPLIVGTECAFAILLTDSKPVLAGICIVREWFSDTNNAFKQPGMRLGIQRLGVAGERVFLQLAAARLAHRRELTQLRFQALAPRLVADRRELGEALGGGVVVHIEDVPTKPLRLDAAARRQS